MKPKDKANNSGSGGSGATKGNKKTDKDPNATKANEEFAEFEAFKKKWDSFDPNREQAFVKVYRTEIDGILKGIAETERYSQPALVAVT